MVSKKVEVIEIENRVVAAKGWGGGNEGIFVKECELAIVRGVHSEAVMCNMVTVVSNTVLYA